MIARVPVCQKIKKSVLDQYGAVFFDRKSEGLKWLYIYCVFIG